MHYERTSARDQWALSSVHNGQMKPTGKTTATAVQIKKTIHRSLELLLFFKFQAFADLRHGQRMKENLPLCKSSINHPTCYRRTTSNVYSHNYLQKATSYNLPLYSSSCFSSTSFVPAFATIVFLVVSISTSRSLMAWKSPQ